MGNATHIGVAAQADTRPNRTTRRACLERVDPGWVRSFSAESLDSQGSSSGRDLWVPGGEYQVPCGGIATRSAPFGEVQGSWKMGTRLALLKVVEESGVLWGYLDPLQVDAARWAMLAITNEQAAAERWDEAMLPQGLGPCLEKLKTGWEVGQSYMLKQGTIIRRAADLSSERVASLEDQELAEILEVGLHEGEGFMKTRLRVKVLTWKTHTTGWISCIGEDGNRLVNDKRQQMGKLDLSGRSAQIYHVSLPGLGGA